MTEETDKGRLPQILAITLTTGQVFEVGLGYPKIEGEARRIEGLVEHIVSCADELDETETAYLVRFSESTDKGFCWRAIVGASYVTSVVRETDEEEARELEASDDVDLTVGIDVRRVIAPLGDLALVIDVGAPTPPVGSWPVAAIGKVESITREEDGACRLKIRKESGRLVFLTITKRILSLELMGIIEAKSEEAEAEEALIAELTGEGDSE